MINYSKEWILLAVTVAIMFIVLLMVASGSRRKSSGRRRSGLWGNDIETLSDSQRDQLLPLGFSHYLNEQSVFQITIDTVICRGQTHHVIANVNEDVLDVSESDEVVIPKNTKLIGLFEHDDEDILIFWHHMHRPEQGVLDPQQWLKNIVSVEDLLDNELIIGAKQSFYLQTQMPRPPLEAGVLHQSDEVLLQTLVGEPLLVMIMHDMFFSKEMVRQRLRD